MTSGKVVGEEKMEIREELEYKLQFMIPTLPKGEKIGGVIYNGQSRSGTVHDAGSGRQGIGVQQRYYNEIV